MRKASVCLCANCMPRAAAAENNMYRFLTVYNFALTFFFTIILILRQQLPVIKGERVKVKHYAAYKKELHEETLLSKPLFLIK